LEVVHHLTGSTHHGLFKLFSPPSITSTDKLWSRFANRPATTQLRSVNESAEWICSVYTNPQDPPPTTMISTSSGIVMVRVSLVLKGEVLWCCSDLFSPVDSSALGKSVHLYTHQLQPLRLSTKQQNHMNFPSSPALHANPAQPRKAGEMSTSTR